MKKKTIIILSICLVLAIGLTISSYAVVEATGEENVYEALKSIVTGNTNRIEKLENQVDTLENEIDKLKGEITELQKPKEEEKETTENKATNTNSSNKKTTTKTNTNTNKSQSVTTTPDYQKQIDTLSQEMETLKKNHIITKEDLIGTWGNDKTTFTFTDNTVTLTEIYDITSTGSTGSIMDIKTTEKHKNISNYSYTLEGNHINLTLTSATTQIIGGTKTTTTKDSTTGEEKTETVEIKATQPVENTLATKKMTCSVTFVNNSLFLNAQNIKVVKN